MTTLLIKKHYTKQDMVKNCEAPGKKYGITSGSWVHDLCALKKVITLCPLCTHKFNPRRLGYVHDKDLQYVIATCDGCTTFDTKCTAYLFEETFTSVRSTAANRRAERTAFRKSIGLKSDNF